MGTNHPYRPFEEVAVYVQTIKTLTSSGNILVLVMVYTFTRFVCSVALRHEQAESVVTYVIDLFGPMQRLLSGLPPKHYGYCDAKIDVKNRDKVSFDVPGQP